MNREPTLSSPRQIRATRQRTQTLREHVSPSLSEVRREGGRSGAIA